MQTSDIYHIWGIKGFKMARLRYMSGLCIVKTNTGEHHCPRCHTDKGSTRLFPKSRESWVKTPRQASPKKTERTRCCPRFLHLCAVLAAQG